MQSEHLLDRSWQSLFDDGLFPPRPGGDHPYALIPVGYGPHASWIPSPAAVLWRALARRGRPPEEITVQGDDLILRWAQVDGGLWLFEQLLLAGPRPPEVTAVMGTTGALVLVSPTECLALGAHLRPWREGPATERAPLPLPYGG